MAYEVNYEKVKTADGWVGKNSYVQEFFGTIFWLFLAHLASVFNLGVGFQFGLAWVITTSIFQGQFNAMTTILQLILGGDPLDSVIRLLVQVLAGFLGYSLFYHLGYTDWAVYNSGHLSLVAYKNIVVDEKTVEVSEFSTAGLWEWFRLFLTLCVYFAAASRLKTGHSWIDTILLLGVTFAIGGGAKFAFAPNRWWFCTVGGWVAQAKGFGWDYLAYAVTAFLAKYVLDLYDGDTTFNWGLPSA